MFWRSLVGFIIAINIGEVGNIAIIETIMGFALKPKLYP
jgi:hypothetical protein